MNATQYFWRPQTRTEEQCVRVPKHPPPHGHTRVPVPIYATVRRYLLLYCLAIRVALVEEEAQVDDPAKEDAVEEEHAQLGRAVGDVDGGGRDEDSPVLDQDAWLGLGLGLELGLGLGLGLGLWVRVGAVG